ncbi:MAG: M20/M25/M40 family metallo-hydrolase [Phycisphaerae bacterium]
MSAMMILVLWMCTALNGISYPEREPPSRPAERVGSISARYREAAERIINAAMTDNDAYSKLEELCVGIGHRLSGSPQLDRAVAWALRSMRQDGHENVHAEDVMVPRWVRGEESASMREPRVEPLAMLGLGGSVGTPPEGVTGAVVVVEDEAQLRAVGEAARGKVVLFNNVMPPYDPVNGAGYSKAVRFRTHGARLASQYGAVACLIRSVTATSLRSPHTGALKYGDAPVNIPAAAVSTEDAELIARLARRGQQVTVTLKMEARTLPDVRSANVVGELRGSTLPDEIIVIGGHLDSWDVGQGAHDDGGGCVAAMEAITILRSLNMIPRRTIRVVLWTNEENGLRGAKAYAAEHAEELDKHVAAIESDGGTFHPLGYSVECRDELRQARAADQMREIVNLLAPLGAMTITTGWSGADIGRMKSAGVVLMGQRVDGAEYFDYHHSRADTIDKVDPVELSENVAALATVAYILADMPLRVGERGTTSTH